MSYCRWSDMDYLCDLYVYEAEEGYVIHIASTRRIGPLTFEPWPLLLDAEMEKAMKAYKNYHDSLESAAHAPIDLPYDGETMSFDTPEELLEQLKELREIGYLFPDYVLTNIEEECRHG